MIQPLLADDAFLADVAEARRETGGFHLWWLGQSGYLLQWQGRHLILDPYLSDSLTRKYADTDKPHVRMTARVVAPERLDFIDVATSSHNHTDHLDAETLGPLLEATPGMALVIPEANRAFVAERLGIDAERPLGVDDGQSVSAAGFHFTGVAAAHEEIERDEEGRCRHLGYLIRFGPWTVYHSGDTVWYDGMVERLRGASIDVALLPINGRSPERRVAGNLDGPEAARLAREIGARLVIPCHFEMFEFNTASPEAFVAEARRLEQACRVLRCGQQWSSGELDSRGFRGAEGSLEGARGGAGGGRDAGGAGGGDGCRLAGVDMGAGDGFDVLSEMVIRRAGREDAEALLELLRALAEYERLEPPDAEARTRLIEHGFGPDPRFEAYLAEIDGAPVGCAIAFETYSTFLARPTLYLEDLFVRPEARRRGAGMALLRHLAAEAVARGCGRMEWTVLDWNELAQGVYHRVGAEMLEDWRICRLTGEALRRLAGENRD